MSVWRSGAAYFWPTALYHPMKKWPFKIKQQHRTVIAFLIMPRGFEILFALVRIPSYICFAFSLLSKIIHESEIQTYRLQLP